MFFKQSGSVLGFKFRPSSPVVFRLFIFVITACRDFPAYMGRKTAGFFVPALVTKFCYFLLLADTCGHHSFKPVQAAGTKPLLVSSADRGICISRFFAHSAPFDRHFFSPQSKYLCYAVFPFFITGLSPEAMPLLLSILLSGKGQ